MTTEGVLVSDQRSWVGSLLALSCRFESDSENASSRYVEVGSQTNLLLRSLARGHYRRRLREFRALLAAPRFLPSLHMSTDNQETSRVGLLSRRFLVSCSDTHSNLRTVTRMAALHGASTRMGQEMVLASSVFIVDHQGAQDPMRQQYPQSCGKMWEERRTRRRK